MADIVANTKEELESILKKRNISVPSLYERKSEDREWYSICMLLSTLNKNDEINFPFSMSKRESPDFEINSNDVSWGVEVIEAIPESLAKALALAEKECINGFLEISDFKFNKDLTTKEIRSLLNKKKLTGNGYSGNADVIEFANATEKIINDKTEKLDKIYRNNYTFNALLIYNNFFTSNDNVLAEEIIRILKKYWNNAKKKIVFNTIYIETGNTLLIFENNNFKKLPIHDLWIDKH